MSTPDQLHAPEKKSRKGLYGTVAVLAGVAIAAGAIVGVGALKDKPTRTENGSSASSEPSNSPEASPSPTPEVLTVQSVEIPAGLTPEKLGEALIDRLSTWDMAAATAVNRDAWLAAADSDAYAQQLAETSAAIYAEALFGPDWQSVPKLALYVPNETTANAGIIDLWFKTSAGTDARDLQPFNSYDTVEAIDVVSQTATSVTERITTTAHNNANANRADELAPGTAALNGEKFVVVATFTAVNGVEKVSGFDIVRP